MSVFPGKERDTESGLDYFGARYYGSTMGRWMSPDWADKPEAVPYSKLDNPQSLNLYGYVLNNPLSHVDADGHSWDDIKQRVRELADPNSARRAVLNDGAKNLYISGVKLVDAAAGLAAAPETLGASVGLTIYGAIGSSGNLAAGLMQTTGALALPTSDMKDVQKGADLASTVTTISGAVTLVKTGGDLDTASKNAAIENSIVTLGTANELFEGNPAQIIAKTTDANDNAKKAVQPVKKEGQQ